MDPTLVFIVLIVGLWLGATSFFIPGTGLAEVGAVGFLGFAFWALAALPTNWAALLLLIVGVAAFILVPLVAPRYTRYAEFALVAQGFGALFLFNGMRVNLIAIAATLALAFAYNRLLLVPMMRRMQEAPAVGNEREEMVGMVGRVTSASDTRGTAYINGETWTVRGPEPLAEGDTVRVVELRGLEVVVERIKAKRAPTELAYENGHMEHNGSENGYTQRSDNLQE